MNNHLFVNTHHAYLNTNVILSCDIPVFDLVDEQNGDVYTINGSPICINLSSGRHLLKSISLNEDVCIFVEDAIKYGGSKLEKAFVFDDSPWVFATTKDRLYIHNIENDYEAVEYGVIPEDIQCLGSYHDKPSDCFLFKTKNDFCVFDVTKGNFQIQFSNHIYSNSRLVIYKNNGRIIVFDFRKGETVIEFCGLYSFGKNFYFIKDNVLNALDLFTNKMSRILSVGCVNERCVLSGNVLIKLQADCVKNKKYQIFLLEGDNGKTEEFTIEIPFYIESWEGVQTTEYRDLCEYFAELSKKTRVVLENDVNKISNPILADGMGLSFKALRVNSFRSVRESEANIQVLYGELLIESRNMPIGILFGENVRGIPIQIKGKNHHLDYTNMQYNPNYIISTAHEKSEGKKSRQYFALSDSGNRCVAKENGNLFFINKEHRVKKMLFPQTYDNTNFANAFFTSDGKKVVFTKVDNSVGIIDLQNFLQSEFDIDGATVPRCEGINGYKPEISDCEPKFDHRKPVWRDPITLRRVDSAELSWHVYQSPDAVYSADTKIREVLYNVLTGKEITLPEYLKLCQKYDFSINDAEQDRETKIGQRKLLLEEYGKEKLGYNIYDYYGSNIKNFYANKYTPQKIQQKIERVVSDRLDDFINREYCFTSLFIDKNGYVIFWNNHKHEEKRLKIGRNVRFLNYVSFSYDSRLLALGAKMNEDTFRHSQEGVFVLYDIIKDREIVRMDREEDLYAVWMTMFNKKGDVAFYDSHANTFILQAKSKYEDIDKISGKSLLCYSPTGNYIALSDQKYIDYEHHPNDVWGHQPSGNIYVHDTLNSYECILTFSDLGDGVSGVSTKAQSVASVAFSSDEEKLLAVGNDGVLVIYNLHTEDYENWRRQMPCGGSDEKHYYRKEERSGFVTITAGSVDGIISELVYYWVEPNESLDDIQGLVFSEDYKILKMALDIYSTEYFIPEGVVKIKKGAFSGRYTWGEGDEHALEVLHLPDTVEFIEETFEECPNLRKIIVSQKLIQQYKEKFPHLSDFFCES